MRASRLDLDPERVKMLIAGIEKSLPVYTIGMSLADFAGNLNRLASSRADSLADFSGLLYELYRYADVAHEPFARPGDQAFLDK